MTVQDETGPCNVDVESQIDVPMRDGVRLATDVYIPVASGQDPSHAWPAVLTRTAYDRRQSGIAQQARFFASHGYLSVVQDVRGTFDSEGDFYPFVNEADDGYDTMGWLVHDPRCNGKVGTYGCSYLGWAQLAMALRNPPGLTCMIPFGTAIDTFRHYAYPDGGRQMGILRWIIYDVWRRAARNNPDELSHIDQIDFLTFASQMPWKRGETALARSPRFENIICNYIENDTYNDFWKQPGNAFDIYFENMPDIPILWISGWYDGYPRSSCEGYLKMSALGRRKNQHLLLGPWIHNQMSGTTCNDAEFGPAADIDRAGVQLAFFDRFLKEKTEVDIPRVRAFLMGGGSGEKTSEGLLEHGGTWRQEMDWPPPDMVRTAWYLGTDGALTPGQPETTGQKAWRHDPDDPVPSVAPPWIFPEVGERGPSNAIERTTLLGKGVPGRPLAARPDVCVFQTEPLVQPVRLLGPLRATLFVSSDAPDTDFAVRLIDLYPSSRSNPDGYAYPVCEGLLRMRYRDGDAGRARMTPGTIYAIEIECFPAANIFMTGHRIRLDVFSSNFPRYDINRNTGEPSSMESRVALNAVHCGPATPSRVTLPVLC